MNRILILLVTCLLSHPQPVQLLSLSFPSPAHPNLLSPARDQRVRSQFLPTATPRATRPNSRRNVQPPKNPPSLNLYRTMDWAGASGPPARDTRCCKSTTTPSGV